MNTNPSPHPIADALPMLADCELQELVADIKANGLREPIWLYQGQILDGRNRHRACQLAEVAPQFREYQGDSPAAFVISMNIWRRHLNPTQRAALATELLPFLEQEAKERLKTSTGGSEPRPVETIPPAAKGKARDKAGKMAGVSGRMVSDAKKIKEQAPEQFEKMKQGKTTVAKAKKELKGKQGKQAGTARKRKPKAAKPWPEVERLRGRTRGIVIPLRHREKWKNRNDLLWMLTVSKSQVSKWKFADGFCVCVMAKRHYSGFVLTFGSDAAPAPAPEQDPEARQKQDEADAAETQRIWELSKANATPTPPTP